MYEFITDISLYINIFLKTIVLNDVKIADTKFSYYVISIFTSGLLYFSEETSI